MNNFSVTAESVAKSFGRRLIFKDINLDYKNSGIYGIAGPNGSGKSTLVKILSGLIAPSKGKVIHSVNGKNVEHEKLHNYTGFVSPYLVLYDEFSAEENILFFSKIRGLNLDTEKSNFFLKELGLYERKNDLLKTYSSGMKQRMKFIFALVHSPFLIILDEPTSNLDNEGKDKVYRLIENYSGSNIVLIASNEENDLRLCKQIVELTNYK
jgi:heme exporter protein A